MKSVCCILLFFCFFSFQLFSQNINDAGLWSTFTLKKEITKKTTLIFDQEFRLRENYTQLNLFYSNIGINFKLNKHFSIEPSYRHIDKYLGENVFSFRHRFSLDLNYKYKVKRFSYSLRARYQREAKNVMSSKFGWLSEKYFRIRAQADYQLNAKLSTYYNLEFRYQIFVPGNDIIFNNRWHRVRNVVGFDYKTSESFTLGLYFLHQTEYDINPIESSYISGIQITKKL
jgi:hypothetical protein